MAHKKGAGSSDNGRDSKSKRLGVKLFGGQRAVAGNIIIRQRGTEFHAGDNVYMGRDHTLHAAIDGVVVFKRSFKDRRFVSIIPMQDVPAIPLKPAKKVASPKVETVAAPSPKSAPATKAAVEAVSVAEEVEVTMPELAPAEKKAAAPKKEKGPKLDDLKIIEGVGPKIETLLKEGGVSTWAELAAASEDRLKEILNAAGPRYQIHDPSTWPAQAKFAVEGKWEELKEYQDMLTGGRDKSE
jgi:large subunit ribosomal protein L27